jgi:abortive infection bacteriophage resistance protein
MKFTKPPLTLDAQVELLVARGMTGDQAKMRRRLGAVNYYRLSGYWHHRRRSDDSFAPGTDFEHIWLQYVFDRRLRLLVMDAVERIEVGVRSQFAYQHALVHGPFGYADDPKSLPFLAPAKRTELLNRVSDETKRNRSSFVTHFQGKYGDEHRFLPIWMVTEALSFGTTIALWQASSRPIQKAVADVLGVHASVLRTWLWSLNEVRNICAHHDRLWNRALGQSPKIPERDARWSKPVDVQQGAGRVFAVLSVCAHSLSVFAPRSQWQVRLRALVEASPQTPLKNMGFPDNWLDSPIWQVASDAS